MTPEEIAEIERKTESQIQTRRDFFKAVMDIMQLEKDVLKATTGTQLAGHCITAVALFTKVEKLNREYSEILTKAIMTAMIAYSGDDPS